MQCVIYKGRRKAETYLYVQQTGDLSRVPEPLLQLLGELEKVMDLTLSADKPLANADVEEVLRLLEEQGYFLQMPPDPNLPRH
jgi:uncharacterized protein YcgL (UPF0745 family)